MILRSFFASVFVVLLVLSVVNSIAKLQASSKKVLGPKVTLFEPYLSESLVCIPFESRVLTHKEKALAQLDLSAIREKKNIVLRTESLSHYPIDTLDPPVVKRQKFFTLKKSNQMPTPRSVGIFYYLHNRSKFQGCE
jgi:hypothetical protein